MADDELRRNQLLAALSDERRAQIASAGEVVSLDVKDLVFAEGARIDHVHFPLEGVLSLLAKFEEQEVEVATVGNEGMVGLPVFLQAAFTSTHLCMCQISARTVRLPVQRFMDLVGSNGDMHGVLHRYTQALFAQTAQGAACNAVHSAPQRAAKWILMTHDRVPGDEFDLTQEFLAQMLGVGRPAVNEAAQALQGAGLIRYTRGHIEVLDRDGLLEQSCPCYRIIRSEYERLLGPGAHA